MNCPCCGALVEIGYVCSKGHVIEQTGIAAPDLLTAISGALMFYAGPDNYRGEQPPVMADEGKLAREALEIVKCIAGSG